MPDHSPPTGPNRKRGREVAERMWSITFDDTSSLKTIFDVIAHVINEVPIHVRNVDGQWRLEVNTKDYAVSVWVSVRLVLDNVIAPSTGVDDFTVDSKVLSYAIESAGSHNSITFDCHDVGGQTKVLHIGIIDADHPKHDNVMKLPILDIIGDDGCAMPGFDVDMTVELDMIKMREIIKKGRRALSEFIRIIVHIFPGGGPNFPSLTKFVVKGDKAECEMCFYNKTAEQPDGTRVIYTVTQDDTLAEEEFDGGSGDMVFDNTFPIDKIDVFVKNVTCRLIMAQVRQNMPMVLNYHLGGVTDDSSHIRYIVAPTVEGL